MSAVPGTLSTSAALLSAMGLPSDESLEAEAPDPAPPTSGTPGFGASGGAGLGSAGLGTVGSAGVGTVGSDGDGGFGSGVGSPGPPGWFG
ncbi:hypothetical protein GCM10027415_14390 [Humibacter ginsengisoli]